MASIIRRATKKGYSYYVIYRHEGKQIWQYAGTKRHLAEKLKAKIEHEINTGIYEPVKDITFKELADKWLNLRINTRPKHYKSTKAHIVRFNAVFGHKEVKRITQEDLETFIISLQSQGTLSPASISRTIMILKSIFRKGIEWGYLSRNPAEAIKKPRVPKPNIEILEPSEIKKLIEATDEKHRCFIMFAALTGCRLSEVLALRWSDIDFASSRVFIRQTLQSGKFYEPKTNLSKRVIDIPPALVKELKIHQARLAVELPQNPYDLVFPTSVGTPREERNTVRRIFDVALKRAGLRKVGFHSLRHSYASQLIHQGEDILTVQRLLGHASAKTTLDRYGHLFEGKTKSAVAKLEESILKEDILQ
ncbi:MAG: tyrosine-type recombinase/integrase [Actinomycetota bacterium]|nr:tyrosine-type recombinase/integrase [Actinomycetota bacterium]